MLSGESAMGDYPVDSVAMLAKIAAAIEPYRTMISARELFRGIDLKGKVPAARLIDLGVETVLEYADAAAVFVLTHNGDTARSIARFRPPIWTIAVSSRGSHVSAVAILIGSPPGLRG